MKQKLIDGDEVDWVSHARKYLKWRPGDGKRIKRKMNKRARRNARIESTAFSDFIRNASESEKERVYMEVMEKATERQMQGLQEWQQQSASE